MTPSFHTTKRIGCIAAFIFAVCGPYSCNSRKFRHGASSMEPTIKAGEFVEVDFSAFKTKSPERWDLVAFEGPIDGKHLWLKRIVGLPGEEIGFDANGLLINGKSVSSPSKLGLAPYMLPSQKPTGLKLHAPEFPYKVPAGRYFVMGDNVGNSLDSRYWGALESQKIVGKVVGK